MGEFARQTSPPPTMATEHPVLDALRRHAPCYLRQLAPPSARGRKPFLHDDRHEGGADTPLWIPVHRPDAIVTRSGLPKVRCGTPGSRFGKEEASANQVPLRTCINRAEASSATMYDTGRSRAAYGRHRAWRVVLAPAANIGTQYVVSIAPGDCSRQTSPLHAPAQRSARDTLPGGWMQSAGTHGVDRRYNNPQPPSLARRLDNQHPSGRGQGPASGS